MAVVFLSFILVSTSVWLAAQKQVEARVSSKMEAFALEQAALQSSRESVASHVEFIGRRALYNLSMDVISEGGRKIDNVPHEHSINKIFPTPAKVQAELCSIIVNGTRFADDATILAEREDTLMHWVDSLNKSTNRIGLNFAFEVENCGVQQSDAWHVDLVLEANVSISNNDKTLQLNRSYDSLNPIVARIPINGTLDAFITLMDYKAHNGEYGDNTLASVWDATIRQIYSSNNSLSDLAPVLVGEGSRGKGWAYGNVTSSPGLRETNPGQYLLFVEDVSDYCNEGEEITAIFEDDIAPGECNNRVLDQFVGVIVDGAPSNVFGTETEVYGECTCTYFTENETGNCLDCASRVSRVEVSEGCAVSVCPDKGNTRYANLVSVPFVTTGMTGSFTSTHVFPQEYVDSNKAVLIDSPGWCNSFEPSIGHFIYDIEALRETAICGYYLEDGDAPSFLQRLAGLRPSSLGGSAGVETMLVGMWARDPDSRVDHVYYGTSIDEGKIKGMPGCKDVEMCEDDNDVPLGHFLLDLDHSNYYGVSELRCEGDECDSNACVE